MKVIVFDLDDTLYKEIDFLKSAYSEIAENFGHPEMYAFMLQRYLDGDNAFKCSIEKYHLPVTIEQLIEIYRTHKPNIALDDVVKTTLATIKAQGIILGLMTDGYTVTQRNKIEALELHRWIADDDILISGEFGYGKPDEHCYRYFMDKWKDSTFCYVGDNLSKDFVTANKVGWTTICLLNDGRNIFKQDFTVDTQYLPKYKINSIDELLKII